MTTYTVRPLGMTSWKSDIATLEEARKELAEARDRGLQRVVIVDDTTGEIVKDDEDSQ